MTELDLTPLEKDLATEMFNLGMNRAAYALSHMTAGPIEISIPEINISNFETVAKQFPQGDVCVVAQSIEGAFDGTALLIFSDDESLHVVEQIMGGNISREIIHEISEDALKEVGNIVLNACVGSMANWLSLSFEVGLPEFIEGPIVKLFTMMGYDDTAVALDIKISLRLPRHNSGGTLSLVLGPVSLLQFKALLAAKLAEIGAQPAAVERAPS